MSTERMAGEADRVPAFSVVVPAHDEAVLIQTCLNFLRHLNVGEAEVVVVANGCTDDTADTARRCGARVVEIDQASKIAALNAGDNAVSVFPRVYLDADIAIETSVLRRLVDLLEEPGPRVAAPRIRFETTRSPLLVKLFYAAYMRTPYIQHGPIGSGLYAVNRAGRARFHEFPAVTADDLFVQRLFAAHETHLLEAGYFDVSAPRSVKGLLAIRTRTAYGSAELARVVGAAAGQTTSATVVGLLRKTRTPRQVAETVVYIVVTVISRALARRRHYGMWDRDASTRVLPPAGA